MMNIQKIFAAALVSGALFASLPAFAADYDVDPAHSKIGFSVRHLVGRVSGEFTDYTGHFSFDPATGAFGNAAINVKAASVNTGIAKRDEHLRSPDFFDTAKFATLSATAGKLQKVDATHYKWNTDLTIHGVTKPVAFTLEYLGSAKDPWGNDRAGFQAKTKINRKDFGLGWNKVLEAGSLMVGEDVEITLDIEAIKTVQATAKK